MKKHILFAFCAALSFTACIGDLEQNPLSDSSVPNGEIYSNPILRKSQLAKIYGGFTLVGQFGAGNADIQVGDAGASEFLRAWWSIQTLSTDEGHCVWGDAWVMEICNDTWTSTKNDAIYAAYTRGMMMISYANEFLRNTNDNDPEVAAERAEVRFLRAYAYWVLLDCFGNPPFVLETEAVGAVKPKQTNSQALFAWIKAELEELTSENSHLMAPHTQVYPRIDKGAAYGLLARLCLNHKTYLGKEDNAIYTQAMDAAKEVIAAYELADHYEALFMGDNGENPDARKEIVYASCYDATKTQSYGGATYLIAASQGNIPEGYKTPEGHDKPLGTSEAWGGLVTSSQFVANLVGQGKVDAAETGKEPEFTAVDNRALVSLRFSDDKEMNGSDFAAGWHVWKFNNNRFLDPATDYSKLELFVSIDFPMIRAAEMYLAYAEAKARIDGGSTSDAQAVQCIADLQSRAGLVPTAGPVSLEDIFAETTRELYWEGFRRTTLIRFDRFTSGTFLWPFKGGVQSGQALADHLRLFPIPSDDLLVNDNLVQNPGY
ncbi:RagB/SusD family nutrient uptake outer membrane protein [uncultured Alistipes sp.]|uniref:RagB/SusD family nutrient uptake outer membrane protein n=1 Tax=uncultured Alistipes sp. TaxID=538949 RepID=UPI00272D44DE|nr:RagB/SusD family nutrient uptake outer membrane protein [uncultured Alistipes sp.]